MNPIDDISDNELSELYHDASREKSPASLDRAILDLAREHVQVHNTNARLRKFTPRFAWAAVIVLSVGVILSIEFESNKDLLESPTTQRALPAPKAKPKPAAETKVEQKTLLQKEEAPQTRQSQPASRDQLAMEDSSANIVQFPVQAAEEQEKGLLERKSAPAARRIARPQKQAPAAPAFNKLVAPTASPSATAAAAASPEPAPAPAPAPSVATSSISTEAVADKAGAAAAKTEASRLSKEQDIASAFSRSPAKLKSKVTPTLEQERARVSQTACQELSAYACAISSDCVLSKTASGLSCRSAANRCESAFNQIEASETACKSKSGCEFISGDCQCNKKSEQCVCSSKGPAICQPLK